jgi:hypothetical protein
VTQLNTSVDEDDLLDKWEPEPKQQRSNHRARRKRRTDVAALGKQLEVMRGIPPKPVNEVAPPKRGPMLEWAMSEEVAGSRIPPLYRKLLCLLAAYADGGNPSPSLSALASRLAIPMPEVMWLLRALEIEGWISAEWTTDYSVPNVYTILRDGD